MAWVGTAMYAASAVGAPAGTALYAGHGLLAIALAGWRAIFWTLAGVGFVTLADHSRYRRRWRRSDETASR